MNEQIAQRQAELKVELPQISASRYQYEQAMRVGDLWFFSGKTPLRSGAVQQPERIGELSLDEGRGTARNPADVLADADRPARSTVGVA
ncbi:hypothetical protein ACWEKM_16270 [Streptomyces sp. NPDC004752]